jgi:NAD(P)-dependent dehydrogenase (short-subunit alcohol dehydrogenase family)
MELFNLDRKVALVTGGTQGIGLMIARNLLQAGAKVYVSSRKPAAGEAAVAELKEFGEVIFIAADVSSEEQCLRLAAEIKQREPALHILVNNAGAAWGAPLEEFPEAGWDKVLAVNLKAPFFVTRAFLPALEAAGTEDDPARVINIGSIDGIRVPEFENFSYTASKAAVHQLTKVLAKWLGPRGITVNAIAPGPFQSKMMAVMLEQYEDQFAAASPLGRIGRPDDVGGTAVYLASRAATWTTGAIIPVDGGIWAAH